MRGDEGPVAAPEHALGAERGEQSGADPRARLSEAMPRGHLDPGASVVHGAHGRLVTAAGRVVTVAERGPESWLALVEGQGHGLVTEDLLSTGEESDEFLLMGLRLKEGVDADRYAAFAGRSLDERRVQDLLGEGLIARRRGRRLAVTREGFPVLDAVVADLAA